MTLGLSAGKYVFYEREDREQSLSASYIQTAYILQIFFFYNKLTLDRIVFF